MYKVDIKNTDGTLIKTIWDVNQENNILRSGTLDKTVDQIDEFKFDLIDNDLTLQPFKTLVEIRNLKKNRIDFRGRIMIPSNSMSEDGSYNSDYTVEGAMTYMHDSYPPYNLFSNYTPEQYLRALVEAHNVQVESYKRIMVGRVNFTPLPQESEIEEYDTTQYTETSPEKSTMQHITDDCIGKWGGEILMRYEADGNYIDWLDPVGELKQTELRIGKNIKSFTKTIDASDVITRLIPLGPSEDNHVGQSVRLTIEEDPRSGGKNYIDIPELQALYGIQVGVEIFEDEFTPDTLYDAGLKKREEIKKKYAREQFTLNLLDLYIIDLDPDDFERGYRYKTYIERYGINEILRITGTNVDITMPHNKGVTIGDKPLTIADVNEETTRNITNTIINTTVPVMVSEQVVPAVETAVDTAMEEATEKLTFENAQNYQEAKAALDADYNTSLTAARQQVKADGDAFVKNLDAEKAAIRDNTINAINSSTNLISADALKVNNAYAQRLVADTLLASNLVSTSIMTNSMQTNAMTAVRANIGELQTKIITAGIITTDKLASGAVTADKLTVDQAFINKLDVNSLLTEKIKTTSIDLNRATIRGSIDSDNYITMNNDEIRQYGTYPITDIDGYTQTINGYTSLKSGYVRMRDNTNTRSLYLTSQTLTTNNVDPINASGTISFFDKSFGASGMYISVNGGGGLGLASFDGEVLVMAAKRARVAGGTSVSMESDHGPVYIRPYEFDISGTNEFRFKVISATSTSDTDGVLGYGNISNNTAYGSGLRFSKASTNPTVYATDNDGRTGTGAFNAKAFNNSSYVEYKQDITKWDYDALSVIVNELDLYQYKYKSDLSTLCRGIIIGDGYKAPPEFINGDSVNLYEMISWSLRAIQQLNQKIEEQNSQIQQLKGA